MKKDQLLVNGMNNEFTQEKMDFVEDVFVSDKNLSQPKNCKLLEAIKHWAKVSHDTEGLRSFLGLVNFLRKFIKRFVVE